LFRIHRLCDKVSQSTRQILPSKHLAFIVLHPKYLSNSYTALRLSGQRGMSPKQAIRLDLAKYIYGKLREVSQSDRGSNSFNWFNTTGKDGDLQNRLLHKIRIWRFEPIGCQIDEGWQNDNLDSQGNYLGPKIVQRPKPSSS
jgi:hypothetical protein